MNMHFPGFICAMACLAVAAIDGVAQNGTLDLSFNAEVNGPVTVVALQPDGKVIVGGGFSAVNGTARSQLARLNKDGGLDGDFNPKLKGNVQRIDVLPNGKILVATTFTEIKNPLFRLNADGTLDTDFEALSPFSLWSTEMIRQLDGRILLGGMGGVYRVQENGSWDGNFVAIPIRSVAGMALQPDGNLIVGGQLMNDYYFHIVRYNLAGGQGQVFEQLDTIELSAPASIVVQPNGQTVVAGRDVVRFNGDGNLDTNFNVVIGKGPDMTKGARSLALQGDGKVLVGGAFVSVNGLARTGIARLNTDGSLDGSFAPALSRVGVDCEGLWVHTMVPQPDGKLLIGGCFSRVGGVTRGNIARLNADVYVPPAKLALNLFTGIPFEGVIGNRYRVELCTNLAAPNWISLGEMTLSNNLGLFIDSSAPKAGLRAYRVVLAP